jgi:hypothetical protein
MADYPLTKLEKALARRGQTSSSRPAWRELMERHDTVPSTKALQAPEVISGFSGSWAATYALEGGVHDNASADTPAPLQLRTNRLGQQGMSEINFRPYDFGTTRHGKYGPSLIGHPISFQVVGPTAKEGYCWHQWYVVENVGGWDELHLDTAATIYSTTATPVAMPATINTIIELYGINAIPAEGLYVVVSMTGSPGYVDDNGAAGTVGGVGDGQIGFDAAAQPGAGARLAAVPTTESSKYEIFRVVSMTATSLVLDSGKRLSDYFTFNTAVNSVIIRSITLVKPAATRVVAVPGSGTAGAEQVFAFVPPAAALNSDMLPLYYSWITGGSFDPWTSGATMGADPPWGHVGLAADYLQATALPVPMPVNRGEGRIQGINGETPAQLTMSRLRLIVDAAAHFDATADVGKLLAIHDVRHTDAGNWATPSSEGAQYQGEATTDRLLGYFEIMAAGSADQGLGANNYYDLRMTTQVDPDTGIPFFGAGNLFRMGTGTGAGEAVYLKWTLHDAIETLWTSTYLHPTKLDDCRLQNLIDPRWVQPTLKSRTVADMDGSPGVPDRAIFDTSSSNAGATGSNANPGSLLDLGFRVVLFPAKESGGTLVPDYDNPIDANEVTLDPAVTGNQFVEIDYSAGLVHLSHPPAVGGELVPVAGILTNAENPRGEAVFFASCVPFSREPGQLGANPRVTAGRMGGADGSFCGWYEHTDHADAYGGRVYWQAAAQTITSGQQQILELDQVLSPVELPFTGFVDVVYGTDNPNGAPIEVNTTDQRLSTFGYSRVDYQDAGNGGNTTLLGVFGGAAPAATAVINPNIQAATVCLRRNIVIPNTSDGRAGTDYPFDTTYGRAKRATALRFKNAATQQEPDGSATVEIADPRTDAHEALFGELFSSWCISGGVMSSVGLGPGFGDQVLFSECVVLIEGVRTVLPQQEITLSVVAPLQKYVVIDGSDIRCPFYTTQSSLPLSTSNDVLIGLYTHDTADVLSFVDLRQPMVDVDQRLDVTVGAPTGHAQPGTAHFNELADAIAFVTETYRTSVAASVEGQFRRIKVIGPTLEDPTKYPIAPAGLNGVIIEGAGWPLDGSVGTPMAITWQSATSYLFDLSDVESWVFRNLVFRYDEDGAGASADPKARCLFTVLTGVAADIVFENIILHGPAHGFFYADDPGGLTGVGFERLLFRNCLAEELTDFAIRTEAAVDTGYSLKVYNCEFAAGKGLTRQLGLADDAVIYLTSAVENPTIKDSGVFGGDHGIRLICDNGLIEGCQISDTDQAGVYLDGEGSTVRDNYIAGVHTTAATFHAVKVAVFLSNNADGSRVLNNWTLISGSGAGDDDIFADTTSQNNIIAHNTCERDIAVSPNCHILDNRVSSGNISAGLSCFIRGNRIITGNLTPGSLSSVVGNILGGTLLAAAAVGTNFSGNLFHGSAAVDEVGSGNHFNGDRFGITTVGGSRVELLSNSSFTNCFFSDAFQDSGVNADGNQFTGCQFELLAHAPLDGDGNQFIGNKFTGAFTFTLNGDENVLQGNTLGTTGALTALTLTGVGDVVADNYLNALLTVSATNSIVKGNQCEQGAALSGDGCLIEGNRFLSTFGLTGDNVLFSGNYVAAKGFFGGAGGVVQNITGNRFLLGFELTGGNYLKDSNITGNIFDGVVLVDFDNVFTVSLTDCTVTGNYFGGSCSARYNAGTTFTGNRFVGDLDSTNSDNYIIMGNRVGGDILVDGGATAVKTGVIVGNRATNIAPAAVVPNNNQVTVANKVDNGASVYTAGAPGTASAVVDNVND